MHCGKKWWIREFVTPSIFPLNPDYVAARSLRSLRSNYWIVYGEQSQNLIVTIVYFKYFQVHNTLSFRKSPVLQSAFSRHTYWPFCVILFYTFLSVSRLFCLDPLLSLIFELVHERLEVSDSTASSLARSNFEKKKKVACFAVWVYLPCRNCNVCCFRGVFFESAGAWAQNADPTLCKLGCRSLTEIFDFIVLNRLTVINALYLGWTMVFKAVGGVEKDVYEVYKSDQTLSEDEVEALNVTNKYRDHYKNRIVLNWELFDASEVLKTVTMLSSFSNRDHLKTKAILNSLKQCPPPLP